MLGLVTIVIVVPLGDGPGHRPDPLAAPPARTGPTSSSLLPLVTPEIVMGASLFIVFKELYTGIPLGRGGADPRAT